MAAIALQLEEEIDYLPRKTAPSAKRQECVLLIEDNTDAMLLVKYAIEEHGAGKYRLEWANSLSDGLEQLSHGGVDLVLLDLGLPECSGPQSYAWVRELAPNIPVVVLTGDACDETEFEVTASGVAGYLVKDQVSGALLLNTIQTALGTKKHRKNVINRLFRPLA